jgi:LmbE family N-acetylglucosaminyl deacetylase
VTDTGAIPSKTVVSFHAHPDDEALLTGGTLAKAAAAGHRVVLVTATNGGAGLACAQLRADGSLGQRRVEELEVAAAAIGAASVNLLGYDDSGMDGQAPGNTFARADVDDAAARLATILRREGADVLTTYDANGGYGHPDHVQVHRVGVLAAQLAGTPAVLEATIDRDLMRRALRVMRAARLGAHIQLPDLEQSYTPRSELTHRIDVRRQIPAKRAALLAHASQASADNPDKMDRTIAFLLRLPPPLFRIVLGSEWFVRRNAVRQWPLASDIFAALEEAPVST